MHAASFVLCAVRCGRWKGLEGECCGLVVPLPFNDIESRWSVGEGLCVYRVVRSACWVLRPIDVEHGSDLVQEIVQYGRGPLCAQRALGMDRWAVILASVAWYGSVCFVATSLVYTAFVLRAVCIHRR